MKKITILSLLVLIVSSVNAQTTADSLLNFISVNKSRASLYLSVNDTMVGRLNENTMMPLASTVKILVAIEFAKTLLK